MKTRLLIAYLAAIAAFAPFSTDIFLSSMPLLAQHFHRSAADVQLTLSLFFLGFALTQLVWGPLSDRIGRKPVLLIGLSLFTLSSLACALSQSLAQLITARLFQSVGACAGIVCAYAIVKDHFTHNLRRTISLMTGILITAPMIAPIIGAYLLTHINWQANFYFLALYSTILFITTLFLTETHPPNKRHALALRTLTPYYWQQLIHPPFLLATLALSTNFCILFSFISSSAFIYTTIYHLPVRFFGYLFAMNAACMGAGSYLLPWLKRRIIQQKHLVFFASSISSCGALIMWVALYRWPHTLWAIAAPSLLVTFGVGVLYAELMHCALQHVLKFNGMASALTGTARFILAAAIAYVMGLFIQQTAYPLPITMLLLSLITSTLMLIYFKRQAT